MRQVRAKFRCLGVTEKWDKSTIVELGPVCQSGKNPENEKFWKYTPSGDAQLNFRGPALDSQGNKYIPGDYYYIDMELSEEGGWDLATLSYHSKESGIVELTTRGGKYTASYNEKGFSYGKLKMGIDNPPAFLAFKDPDSTWDIQFNWAEASDS